jgi:hypothetical protein
LKEKGYTPETTLDEEVRGKTPTHAPLPSDAQYDHKGPKKPRPETEPVREKRAPTPRIKDPKLKRTLFARNILIIFGVVILIISLSLSYQSTIGSAGGKEPIEKTGYNLKKELLNYKFLKMDSTYDLAAWDAFKYIIVTLEDIKSDLEPECEFLIEVRDLSQYPIKYNRTIDNRLAWCSVQYSEVPTKDVFEISTLINIYHTSEEVHLAKLTVSVWR